MKRIVLLIASVIVASIDATASAGFVLSFSQDGSSNTLNRLVGEPTVLSIYIRQTDGETRLSDNGLIGFAFRLTFDETLFTIQSASIAPSFNLLPVVRNSVGQVDFLGGAVGLPETIPRATGDSLLLSTMTVTGIRDGIAPLQIKYLPDSFSEFTLNDDNLTAIHTQIFGTNLSSTYSQNFNITSVPEPETALLWMIGIVFAALQGFLFARKKNTTRLRHHLALRRSAV